MPPVNWDEFERLPGGPESNFELLCRGLVRRNYGRYGDFAALAQQPGVEFHLRLHASCELGDPGRWYGWQCRWYDLPGGRAIGTRRRRKIVDAITKTERELPDLTDWVLWTRRPLTERDQQWFYRLETSMRLHLWTAAEVEDHLSGPAEILRGSYFGELVLTPGALADLHRRAVAPIRQRWQPEVHQIVDAERTLRRMLGDRPGRPSQELAALPRRLRAARSEASLTVTNALADDRRARSLFSQVDADLGERVIAVLADAGCGKTQLAAQLTAAVDDRPAGVLLQGRDLHAGHDLDDLAGGVVIQGLPVSSMEALVAAIDAAGQRAQRRLPIVIDGLNEAEDPRDWKSALASLNETLRLYPYVLVVCTVRTAFADEAVPADISRLEIPDFDHDTVDAVRRYFEYYRIDPVNTDLPWELLSHPLTLRFFCEVTNPTRESVVGVEAMPGSLIALFDRYLKQAAERIAELASHAQRYYEQDVRNALYEIGVALWDEKSRGLDYAALRRLLGDSQRPWDHSLVRPLEEDGVLLRFPGDTPTSAIVTVVFDALAGHVVADAFLARHGRAGLEEQLRDPATVGALAGTLPEQHPLESDTLRALVGLVPRRLHGQQLWTMLDEPLRTNAVLAAAELEGDYLDAATVDELAMAAARAPSGRRDLFDRLRTTRGSSRHPLNAEFLDDALRPMSVADRDLRWTEWVRRHQDETLGDLRRLEQRWRSEPTCAHSDGLLARWVMWTLTSTVRVLRDQATRTLYWLGRADPAALFDLAVDALGVNDPYVPERMLAAGYGVSMALQHDAENGAFVDEVLPRAAEEIYAAVFAPGAPHATTHLLARSYARRIIEIAVRHQPGILTEEQLERTRPPYEEGGIREWGESEDRNEGEYREGNHPFGFLDEDPMNRLGPDISKYHPDTPQYEKAKANLWWRIYDLGYSLEKFGSVDGQLASSSYRRSSHEDGGWVDGYGRKYSWIATCEFAGFRDDLGLLKREWDDEQENWTHVDLDPSFPEQLPSYELVPGDLLGNREQDLRDWVSSEPSHTFEEILVLDELQGERGPWVLLWGYVSQDDREAQRRMFCFLQGALIDASEAEEVAGTVGRVENVDLHTMHVPDTHYTYAGEIPWCETYPANEPFSVTITTGYETATVTETETRYVRGDERMSREEYFLVVLERFGGDSSEDTESHVGEPMFTRMERIAQEMGIRQVEESVTKEVEVPEAVVCDVTMPVRGHGWEDYHSELNPSTGANTPARQIADVLGLVGRPQTFDLYDSSGRRASATFQHGGRFSDKQEFTYLRKDLLDRYLKESGQRLRWHIFGERAILESDPGARRASSDGPPYVRYDEVRMYD